MKQTLQPSQEKLAWAVDTFWESFPPFWRAIGAHIRGVALERFDISVEQFHILRHIRKGQSTVSELAEAKGISRPAISQAVDALVNKKLITRMQDEQDRRHVRLELTPDGDALLDEVFDNTRQWMMRLLAALSEEEVQGFILAMESMKKVLPA